MPYIKQEDRKKFDEALDRIEAIATKGELEYCIFKLMLKYMENKELRYSTLHDTAYAAAHCSDEFRRRFLDKREDMAMSENGDVELYAEPPMKDVVMPQHRQMEPGKTYEVFQAHMFWNSNLPEHFKMYCDRTIGPNERYIRIFDSDGKPSRQIYTINISDPMLKFREIEILK